MKKFILVITLLVVAKFGVAQKYVLIDETMANPPRYTNDVSLKNIYKNVFVVEANNLKEFVSALNQISSGLISKDKKDNNFNLLLGVQKLAVLL